MEIIKNNIHMNKILKNEAVSIFVNREERLMESMPEISEVINHKEMVTVDNVSVRNGQINISGTISYCILYSTSDTDMVQGIEGEIPFEEIIKIQGLQEDNDVDVRLVVVSSNVKNVDSRNYIYKVQMMAHITVEHMEDLETVIGANREKMMTKYNSIDCLSVISNKVDTFKISEQLSIPSGKPSIEKIVWKDLRIKSINTKMMDGRIHIGGELYVFLMYIPEGSGMSQQWLDTTINFGGTIEMDEAREDMISYIDVNLHNINIDTDMDQDNEMRNLNINALLKLKIKLYDEKHVDVLDDVYSPDANLVPTYENRTYEKLLVKNESRTKVTEKHKVDSSKGHILQICNSSAQINIDNIIVSDNGLKAVGKIKTCVMYISSDDSQSVCCQWKENDFEHRIDAEGIDSEDKYYINWRVEQVSANMLSTDEIEVKAVIALEAIVFNEESKAFIAEIREEPVDMEAINQAPLIKGYVVQSGDTLWKLAKENYTTIEKIMEVNELKNEQVKKGDRLLLVKSCQ